MATALPIQLAAKQKLDTMHWCSMWFQSNAILVWFTQVFTPDITVCLATTTDENNSKRSATEVTINWDEANNDFVPAENQVDKKAQ